MRTDQKNTKKTNPKRTKNEQKSNKTNQNEPISAQKQPPQTIPSSKHRTPNQIKVDFQRIRCTIIQACKKSFAKGFNDAI
jgi:hypothetical protein